MKLKECHSDIGDAQPSKEPGQTVAGLELQGDGEGGMAGRPSKSGMSESSKMRRERDIEHPIFDERD
jgi:hypothetical protein